MLHLLHLLRTKATVQYKDQSGPYCTNAAGMRVMEGRAQLVR